MTDTVKYQAIPIASPLEREKFVSVVSDALDAAYNAGTEYAQGHDSAAVATSLIDQLEASPQGEGSSADADTHRAAERAVRVFIDCEFDGHDGPLLSIALVKNDGDSIHIRADVEPMDLWVRQNVLTVMDAHCAPQSATVYHNEVGGVIRAFLGDTVEPVIVADSPVDIGRFCRALSTGPDGGWASADYPRMTFEVHNVDSYPTDLVGAVQHNAWWDAMALQRVLTRTASSVGASEANAPTPPAKPEWITHDGGPNPVPGKRVQIRCRDGGEAEDESENWTWDSTFAPIIAYRVTEGVKP